MPGIFSARWAGRHGDDEANLELLLGQLADVPDERRGARFVCAAALALPDGDGAGGRGTDARARWSGRRGGPAGFGYDPIFVPDGETVTTAEMTGRGKDAISHRGQAFRALAPVLRELLAEQVGTEPGRGAGRVVMSIT